MKTCNFDSSHKKDGPLIFKSHSCCFPFEVHSDESNVLGSSCEVNIISKSVPFAVMPRGLCPLSTSPPPPPPPPYLKRKYNRPESCRPLFNSDLPQRRSLCTCQKGGAHLYSNMWLGAMSEAESGWSQLRLSWVTAGLGVLRDWGTSRSCCLVCRRKGEIQVIIVCARARSCGTGASRF